jgi:hypothetical protein
MLETNQIPSVVKMIDRFLAKNDMLVSTKDFLLNLRAALSDEVIQEKVKIEDPDKDKIIISCDASIKENPGGPAAVGIVIERPGIPISSFSIFTKAETNNQAEYDAIYTGLIF